MLIATFFISTNVYSQAAGGGYISSSNPQTGGGSYYNHKSRNKEVDAAYELGKSIYRGRKEGAPKLNYCIAEEQDKVKLKRKSIKKFKKSTYAELAQNLYDCDKPNELVSKSLSSHQLSHVLYYLDKRFKLKLSQD